MRPLKKVNGATTDPPYTAQRSSTAVKEPLLQGQRPYETLVNPSLIGVKPKDQGEIKQSYRNLGPSLSEIVEYGSGQKPGYMKSRNLPEDYYEPLAENLLELFDPTGILSHDDARASYDSWQKSGRSIPTFEESLNMVSTLPVIGKFKVLGRMAHQPKLFDFLQGSWNSFISTSVAAKKIDNVSDVTEMMEHYLDHVSKKEASDKVKMIMGGKIKRNMY